MTDRRKRAASRRLARSDKDQPGTYGAHAPATVERQRLGAARSPLHAAPSPRSLGISPAVPERYEVRESEDGRFLHCDEAPRVRVCIDPKRSISEADARAMGSRVIFLDGAGDFPPKLDNKTRFYNLDHHQGCIRPFTLATCEQALVLVKNGLELDEGDWTLYVGEPDLDTLFAIWVLLNFRRISKLSGHSRDVLLPLLRLEGAIDANGPELADFCGLTQNTLREARARLDTLYNREKEFRSKERWSNLDWREYTAAMLAELDQLVYTRADFQDHTSIEEILGHVEIAERKVAVACRDQSGIYEAERSLKNRFGEQLGIIALEKSKEGETRHYTLRRVSAILNFDLESAYDLLNIVDPAVDGRPPGNRWGGSDDIGGSPRSSGTRLHPSAILRILQQAYRRKTPRESSWPWLVSMFSTASLLVVGAVAAFVATAVPELRDNTLPGLTQGGSGLIAVSLVTLAFVLPATFSASQGRPWMFGWRRPGGRDWLYLIPVVIACSLPANAWVPRALVLEPQSLAIAFGVTTLMAVACEAWFRGAVHGWFLFHGPIQRVAGPWMFSRAASISTFLYMLVYLTVAFAWNIAAADPFPQSPVEVAVTAAAALAAGAALAIIRERSLSLLPCIAAQILGGATGAVLTLAGVTLF